MDREQLRTWGPVLVLLALLPVAFVVLRLVFPPIGPRSAAPAPSEDVEVGDGVGVGEEGKACADCHEEEQQRWASSTHARAEGPLTDDLPATVPDIATAPVRTLGADPLIQFLIPAEKGRVQVTQAAWDPQLREWFDVFGDDRKEGDWGHWTGGAMTWNARCAQCHSTGVVKGYDAATDTYATTVEAHGLTCAACHVQPARAPSVSGSARAPSVSHEAHATRPDASVCAPCHARRAELDEDWEPGDAFLDHFAPTLVDGTPTFWPDGQVREEDFEYTAFLGSKMSDKGVTCLSCHDPHSSRTVRDGDALCLGCHAAMPSFAAHDPHAAPVGCVGCHMPVTTYMQRDPRHDHGFTVPDPWLTVEHGIPNACSRCHADRDARWALDRATAWYGDLGGPRRDRADALARGREGDAAAIPALLHTLRDDGPAWRAAAAGMLGAFADREDVSAALRAATADPDGHVRFAAVGALTPVAPDPAVDRTLESRRKDPLKAVRVQTSRALAFRLDPSQAPDYAGYLAFNADQPPALHERGTWALQRGRTADALRDLQRAVDIDGAFVPARDALAVALSTWGRPAEARDQLREVVKLAPEDAALWFRLGLAEGGAGDLVAAGAALERSVALDPSAGRSWYNLGLVRQQLGQSKPAVQALREAVARSPADAGIAYALASVLQAQGRTAEARVAAERVLSIEPSHEGARAIRDGAPVP